MLIDLLKHDRLGSSSQARHLIGDVLTCNKSLSILKVKKKCLDHSAKFGLAFNGLIELLIYISLLKRTGDLVELDCKRNNIKGHVTNDYAFCCEIAKRLFWKFKEDGVLGEIFKVDGIQYRPDITTFLIKGSYIPLKYANIRKLLVDFGIFEDYSDSGLPNSFKLNREFKELFEEHVVSNITHQKKINWSRVWKRSAAIVVFIVPIVALIHQIFFDNKADRNIQIQNEIHNENNFFFKEKDTLHNESLKSDSVKRNADSVGRF